MAQAADLDLSHMGGVGPDRLRQRIGGRAHAGQLGLELPIAARQAIDLLAEFEQLRPHLIVLLRQPPRIHAAAQDRHDDRGGHSGPNATPPAHG